jgi:hypothetical protein
MEDQLLSVYLPLLGDRIAVRSFCHEFGARKGKSTSKKAQLVERPREKLNKGHMDSDDDDVVQKRRVIFPEKFSRGKEKKRLTSKTICVGWLHDCGDGSFLQVRQNNGGGSCSLQVPVNANKHDIINEAKALFFPNSLSPLGNQSEFQFDLFDITKQPIKPDATVKDIIYRIHPSGPLCVNMVTTEVTSLCVVIALLLS